MQDAQLLQLGQPPLFTQSEKACAGRWRGACAYTQPGGRPHSPQPPGISTQCRKTRSAQNGATTYTHTHSLSRSPCLERGTRGGFAHQQPLPVALQLLLKLVGCLVNVRLQQAVVKGISTGFGGQGSRRSIQCSQHSTGRVQGSRASREASVHPCTAAPARHARGHTPRLLPLPARLLMHWVRPANGPCRALPRHPALSARCAPGPHQRAVKGQVGLHLRQLRNLLQLLLLLQQWEHACYAY